MGIASIPSANMNRLKDYFGDSPVPDPTDDFYVIVIRYTHFCVSRETATVIELVLDQACPPRWVAFCDLSGSRHRVLTEQISRVSESTADQRAADRAFDRARRREEKQDRRPWEDDD